MKEFFKDVRSDKTTNIGFFTSLALIIVTLILTLFFYGKLPPFVPIFNQLPWGEERLGRTIAIFVPILTATSIFVLNLIASALVYKKIPLVSRMFAGTSLLVTILTFLFIVKTIILIL
ncbi:MAG: hypothetical protein HYT07_00600 [Candidatus Levybacteria bacterium]|nr:hypothetical protein [Candidatus Levybacteria bacterium]